MKRVSAFGENILLSNVAGKIYATSDRCGHQNASLSRGTLNGTEVTCPLHYAKFDVTTGKNISGPQMMMPPEVMAKIPQEVMIMFQKSAEIMSEIQVQPLKTYKATVDGDSISLENAPRQLP
jgi:nitrite reductase/ring-hydroxylating ferredoxin subunit